MGSDGAFPVSLSSLHFPSAALSVSQTLSSLRRSALSITNRLRSIEVDAQFVQEVADHYHLPLIANERCGSWYISPERKAGSAYFKSTDGHTGQWDFSFRRLNLQVLPIARDHGG
jgi:tRNA A64-2'-O-ribosylphosphate transferase